MTLVPRPVLNRYRKMLKAFEPVCLQEPGTAPQHLLWMLNEIETFADLSKAMRWLGFVQGSLIAQGYTTVKQERNFTRPYFNTKEGGE